MRRTTMRVAQLGVACLLGTLSGYAAEPRRDGFVETDPLEWRFATDRSAAVMGSDGVIGGALAVEAVSEAYECPYGTGCVWVRYAALPKAAIDVARSWRAASDTTWAVTSDGKIYKVVDDMSSWQLVPGGNATRVAAGRAKAWVVGGGMLFERSGPSWANRGIAGQTIVDVAVGDETMNYVWAKDNLNRLWKYSGGNSWTSVTSGLSGGIDASSNGTVWVVASPYRYVYYKPISGSWVQTNGLSSAIDIAGHKPTSTWLSAFATQGAGIYVRATNVWSEFQGECWNCGEPQTIGSAVAIQRGLEADDNWHEPVIAGTDGFVYGFRTYVSVP